MKLLVNLFFSFTLLASLLLISACEKKEVQSFEDKGPAPIDVDIIAEEKREIDETGATLLQLRAAPTQTLVELDWDEVTDAVDYRVTRQLQQNGSNEIVEFTNGVTQFSFATSVGQTYLVEVAAINQNDEATKISKVLTVKTGSANAIQTSDIGPKI